MGGNQSSESLAPEVHTNMIKSIELFNSSSDKYLGCIEWKCADLFMKYHTSYEDFKSVMEKAKENEIEERMKALLSFMDRMNRTWLPDAVTIKCDTELCKDDETSFVEHIDMMKAQLDFLNQRWTSCSFKDSMATLTDKEKKELEFN